MAEARARLLRARGFDGRQVRLGYRERHVGLTRHEGVAELGYE